MATPRTAALNLLRLAGFRSIRAGMQAVMHDITRYDWRWHVKQRNRRLAER